MIETISLPEKITIFLSRAKVAEHLIFESHQNFERALNQPDQLQHLHPPQKNVSIMRIILISFKL